MQQPSTEKDHAAQHFLFTMRKIKFDQYWETQYVIIENIYGDAERVICNYIFPISKLYNIKRHYCLNIQPLRI